MSKNIFVLGNGSIAKKHAKRLLKFFPKQDISQIGSRSFKYSNHKDEKYAFAVIASPASHHIKHLNDIHEICNKILIEKPLSNSIQAAESYLKENKNIAETNISVAYCLRFHPLIQALKKILSLDVMGNIYNIHINTGSYLPDWRKIDYRESVSANKKLGGGVLLELSHELDLILWLRNKITPICSKLRTTKELSTDVEEIADILFEGQSGELISMHLDFFNKTPKRSINILASNGNLSIDLINNKIIHDGKNKKIDNVIDKIDYSLNMYDEMLSEFLNGKSNFNSKNLASFNDALRVLNLIKKIRGLS